MDNVCVYLNCFALGIAAAIVSFVEKKCINSEKRVASLPTKPSHTDDAIFKMKWDLFAYKIHTSISLSLDDECGSSLSRQ